MLGREGGGYLGHVQAGGVGQVSMLVHVIIYWPELGPIGTQEASNITELRFFMFCLQS